LLTQVLSKGLPTVLPLNENSIAIPQSGARNLRRLDVIAFFAKYGECGKLEVRNSNGFYSIDFLYEGLAKWHLSMRKDIIDVLFYSPGAVSDVGANGTIPSKDLFTFLQIGNDLLEMVTAWNVNGYLPSISLGQGTIFMQPDIRMKLIAYLKEAGTEPEYWEKKPGDIEL